MAETKKTEAAAAVAPPEAACLTLRQKLVEMRKACPEIVKTQHIDGVSYKYAKIYDVWEKITPIMNELGVDFDVISEQATRHAENGDPVYWITMQTKTRNGDKLMFLYEADLTIRWLNLDNDDETIEATVHAVGWNDDPAKAKEIALSMYNRGADFVQHIAGASGMGVFTAAKEADRYAFGVGGNQNYIEPDYIVATALRDVNTIVYNEIKALVEGTWEPGVHISGIAEGSVGFDNTDSNVVLPDDIAAAVEDIKAKITAGELVPCETAEELDAWVAANQYQPAE